MTHNDSFRRLHPFLPMIFKSPFGPGGFAVAAVGAAAFGTVGAWHARGTD